MTGLASIIVLSCATHAFADGNAAYMAHVEIGFPVPGGLVTPTFWPRFALVADDRFLQVGRRLAKYCRRNLSTIPTVCRMRLAGLW